MGMMERQPPPEATAAGSGSAAQRLPLLIIVIGVLLLATLIPHIFNPSTLLISPSPSTVCLPFLCTLYIYTRLRYGSLHLRSRKPLTPNIMKLTIATLLLSPVFVFASPDSKAAKLAKAKFPKMSKSYGGNMCMSTSSSMSMSFGPEPPITVKACGESFTNQKVVLTEDLNCGGPFVGGCAVTLDGPFAEVNCNDFKLSQVANPPYLD